MCMHIPSVSLECAISHSATFQRHVLICNSFLIPRVSATLLFCRFTLPPSFGLKYISGIHSYILSSPLLSTQHDTILVCRS